ncbi:hypothetical protein J6590_073873 [Homalodisca vitripennis]|nr:hypothetical protein J6590_073873 [Homalodisca vitripennis]
MINGSAGASLYTAPDTAKRASGSRLAALPLLSVLSRSRVMIIFSLKWTLYKSLHRPLELSVFVRHVGTLVCHLNRILQDRLREDLNELTSDFSSDNCRNFCAMDNRISHICHRYMLQKVIKRSFEDWNLTSSSGGGGIR